MCHRIRNRQSTRRGNNSRSLIPEAGSEVVPRDHITGTEAPIPQHKKVPAPPTRPPAPKEWLLDWTTQLRTILLVPFSLNGNYRQWERQTVYARVARMVGVDERFN
ncbi:hypothetical protein TWF102_006979 [Orbilia oligospora]|uniref:Uncharacterized protein n=1 Tax=Orbilia oligospora TaxID=2813651 RepID=A0A7C8JIH2_ORBOL|nr:hypothetical protein TWF102_006979 [Orbilia oligospora]